MVKDELMEGLKITELEKDRPYWVGFNVFQGIGPKTFRRLLKYFGSAQAAWEASEDEVKLILGEKVRERFSEFRRKYDAEQYFREIRNIKGIRVLISAEGGYPELLREIEDPPPVLYVLGNKEVLAKPQIGVVGTRKMTDYGARVARELTEGLVDARLVITSGMAYGIDTVAHTTALRAGGETVAVLGCGVDLCAPADHQKVYEEIIQQGAVASEIPPGMRTNKGIFSARNRIISGLSLGVLVVEGAAKSGTLITAEHAKKQGRKIFAVPGPITSRYSDGPNKLIQEGAKAVRKVEDILEELAESNNIDQPAGKGFSRAKPLKRAELSDGEKRVVEVLARSGGRGVHIDRIVRQTALDSGTAGRILSMLEVEGVVVGDGVGKYRLI